MLSEARPAGFTGIQKERVLCAGVIARALETELWHCARRVNVFCDAAEEEEEDADADTQTEVQAAADEKAEDVPPSDDGPPSLQDCIGGIHYAPTKERSPLYFDFKDRASAGELRLHFVGKARISESQTLINSG
jgi:hypothetical protein